MYLLDYFNTVSIILFNWIKHFLQESEVIMNSSCAFANTLDPT